MSFLKKTPLFDLHQRYGAKIIDFGGWAMPVQYKGIIEEHLAIRGKAGLFDVSHMGEITVSGRNSLAFLQRALTNDLSRLAVNQIVYSPMCNEKGGTVDDLLVYRLGETTYLLVVNAANKDKDFHWLLSLAEQFNHVVIEDVSDKWAELAVQGPKAQEILQKLSDINLAEIKYYWFRSGVSLGGKPCLVSRTGYTGEDGFEVYCEPLDAAYVWDALFQAGREDGLICAGLGARDTLRLEAGMPLYGHELDEETSPLEAGLGRFVVLAKGYFVGREALLEEQRGGLRKKLVGLATIERGIPRASYEVLKNGEKIGYVTSGSYSPSLDRNIAMAYVPPGLAKVGEVVAVNVRGHKVRAEVVKLPFYKRALPHAARRQTELLGRLGGDSPGGASLT